MKNRAGWLFLSIFLWSYQLQAQQEVSNASATGRGGTVNTFAHNYQAIGVNPAQLGRPYSSAVSFTLMESGLSVNSRALPRSLWRKVVDHPDESLPLAEKERLARLMTNDNVLNLNLEVNTIALSVQHPKFGGIAFSNRHRVTSHVAMNKNMAEVFFLGQHAPVFAAGAGKVSVGEAFAGSSLQASYLNEWNLAYGRSVFSVSGLDLAVGAGYRYIQGIGVFDFTADKGQLRTFHSLSPVFSVDYGRHALNPAFNLREPGWGLPPVGRGHGFDAGLSAEIWQSLRLAVSVTDMGAMRWKGNLLVAEDAPLRSIESEGAASYDFFNEGADVADLVNKSSLSYAPGTNRLSKLPTRLRTGIGFKASQKVTLGIDYVRPLNDAPGNLPASFVGLGVDYLPVRFFRLSSGLTAGAGDFWNLPLGIGLIAANYEVGIGTRDVLGLVTPGNPTMSVAAGFLRFKFGKAAE